jgi:hypothetical protein
VPGQVWAGASDEIRVDRVPVRDQPFQGFAHGHDVVKNQESGYKVVVFDELALLGGQRVAAEGDLLEELIEPFALDSRCLDQAAQFDV